MTQTFPINGARLRQAMLEQGISERRLGVMLNVGFIAVRTMLNTNQVNGALSVAHLYRILRESGLKASELLDPDPPVYPDSDPDDDVTTLAQLLHRRKTLVQPHALAIALNWDRDHLNKVIKDLDARLRPLGLFIHRNAMGLGIETTDDRYADAEQKLELIRDSDENMNFSQANALYRIFANTHSKQETRNEDKLLFGSLVNKGTIVMGEEGRSEPRITDDTAYCLNVDD